MADTQLRDGDLNLTNDRAPRSAWQRRSRRRHQQRQILTRVLIGVGGAVLAARSARRGSWTGRMLAGLGGTMAWWALTGEGDMRPVRRWFTDTLERRPWGQSNPVNQAGNDSFPASDPTPWTPPVVTATRRATATH